MIKSHYSNVSRKNLLDLVLYCVRCIYCLSYIATVATFYAKELSCISLEAAVVAMWHCLRLCGKREKEVPYNYKPHLMKGQLAEQGMLCMPIRNVYYVYLNPPPPTRPFMLDTPTAFFLFPRICRLLSRQCKLPWTYMEEFAATGTNVLLWTHHFIY